MKVYEHPVITELTTFYGDLLTHLEKYSSLKSHLSALALRLFQVMKELSLIHI